MPKCILCGSQRLRKLLSFDKYPLCIGVLPPELKEKVKSFPLRIACCDNCSHIQQMDTVAEEYKEVLYKYEYSDLLSSVPAPSKTGIGKEEAQKCFNFFKDCKLPLGKVLDIGCYDGYFLSLVSREDYEVWGIEPNPVSVIAEEKYKIPIIRDFFSEKYFKENEFDIIILRNLLEHIVELNNFLDKVNKVLKPGGYIIIEVPNISLLLKEGGLGFFCHQHLSYFSLNVLRNLFSRHSLEYVNSQQDYSIYLCVKKIAGSKGKSLPFKKEKEDRNKEMESYFFEYDKRRKALRSLLRKEEKVAIFCAGGHTTGLIHMLGEDSINKIKYVYDNNSLKQGMLLADIPITVRNPQYLRTDKPDVLVISSYIYQAAILGQVKKMKIPGLNIIVIYPTVKIEN